MKIKDLKLPDGATMAGIRFIFPGDGQAYYWASQWQKGVWGKLSLGAERVYPLFVEDIAETLEWEVVE